MPGESRLGHPYRTSDLRDAADIGAADAPCAVCADPTTKRLLEGDGVVPICSTFCEHAWPNVRKLYAVLHAAEKYPGVADCECEQPRCIALREAVAAWNGGDRG